VQIALYYNIKKNVNMNLNDYMDLNEQKRPDFHIKHPVKKIPG